MISSDMPSIVQKEGARGQTSFAGKSHQGVNRYLLPIIAVAEIECGMARVHNSGAEPQRVKVREFLSRFPVLPFDEKVVKPYSLLRAKLWHICGQPATGERGRSLKLPEGLCDPISGDQLGIDERDLQIVSIALAYNLALATLDREIGMLTIEKAAAALEAEGELDHLEVENWSLPAPTKKAKA